MKGKRGNINRALIGSNSGKPTGFGGYLKPFESDIAGIFFCVERLIASAEQLKHGCILTGKRGFEQWDVMSLHLLQIFRKPQPITNAARQTERIVHKDGFEKFVGCTPLIVHDIDSVDFHFHWARSRLR